MGWHVPGGDEWNTLSTFLGGESVAGGKMKETGTTHWLTPNTGATNVSGFSGLPGGLRTSGGNFDYVGSFGYWSSSSMVGLTIPLTSCLGYIHAYLILKEIIGLNGFSVRCVKGDVSLATVTTNNVSNVTLISGGNVTSEGGAEVTARGVCWGTSPNPTIDNSRTSDGTGTGIFTSSLTGLMANTHYYARAYASNAGGTAYGNEVTFTTMPTITTSEITIVASNSATGGGTVDVGGSAAITARGVCWNLTGNPTTACPHPPVCLKTVDGTGTGSFTSIMTTDITAFTHYYVRAYAINAGGTWYGNQVEFTTTTASTDVDGNVYNTVVIGTQVWMAENLKTTQYRNTLPIPNVTDNTTWAGLTTGAGCWYNNDIANRATYGALYNWYAINTGWLCPTGWHVPSNTEWTTLTSWLADNGYGYQGSGNDIAKSMAAKTNWNSYSTAGNTGNDPASNNSSGFSGLPGGTRDYGGNFYAIGGGDYWWSSTEYSTPYAWSRYLGYSNTTVSGLYANKRDGSSVRCVRDW